MSRRRPQKAQPKPQPQQKGQTTYSPVVTFDDDAGFFMAVAKKDEAKVARLLSEGNFSNLCSHKTLVTPIMTASIGGNLNIVKMLVEAGANVNAAEKEGRTALFFSIQNEFFDIVRFLLESGANPNTIINKATQESILDWSVKNALFDFVKLLVLHGAEINVKNKEAGPLFLAMCNKRQDVIDFFLEHGALIDIPTFNGSTTLMQAIKFEHIPMVRLFLERGASVNAKNDIGMTPLMFAVGVSNIFIMEMLLDKGADIEQITSGGETVLHFAAMNGSYVCTSYLLFRGANPNSRGIRGRTPLIAAAQQQKNGRILNLLLSYGADPNLTAEQDISVLEFVMMRECLINYDILLKHGAPLRCLKKERDDNPVISAISFEKQAVLDVFLDNGIDPNLLYEGASILALSSAKGSLAIMKDLLDRGADVNLMMEDESTALIWAVKKNQYESVKLLLRYGADPLLSGPSGLNAVKLCTNPRISLLFKK